MLAVELTGVKVFDEESGIFLVVTLGRTCGSGSKRLELLLLLSIAGNFFWGEGGPFADGDASADIPEEDAEDGEANCWPITFYEAGKEVGM